MITCLLYDFFSDQDGRKSLLVDPRLVIDFAKKKVLSNEYLHDNSGIGRLRWRSWGTKMPFARAGWRKENKGMWGLQSRLRFTA